MIRALEPAEGESLLDFGCGTGALSRFLPEGIKYLGFDWAPGMIERARREHPDATFAEPWLLPDRPFDLVVAIGTFNLADGWSKDHTASMLRILWGRTKRALAACLYAGDHPHCLSYTEEDLKGFVPEAATVEIERHRPNDLLLVLRRS